MSNDLDNLKEQFYRDTEEILVNVEQSLLEVESGSADSGVMDAMFRDFHTLKGNAGMVGEGAVQELCHAVESKLDPVRKGREEIADSTIQAVFEVVDLLRRAVGANNPTNFKDELAGAAAALSATSAPGTGHVKTGVSGTASSDSSASVKRRADPQKGRVSSVCESDRESVDCTLQEFRRLFRRFYPLDTAANRLSEDSAPGENASILEDMGMESIELQDCIPDKFGSLKSLGVYIEKLLVLLIRNDIEYDPFSFELLDRLISDFRDGMIKILEGGDFMLEVPIPNMRSLSYLEEVIDAGKEILIVRLKMPYKDFISHEESFPLLKRLYQTERHYVIYVLAPNETISKAASLVKDSVEEFPEVYDSLWSGLQELLQSKKELTNG